MHDADVFFLPGGLESVLRYLSALPQTVDLVVSDNGPPRAAAFDGLNWGFVYLASPPLAATLLSCLLATWTHPVFERLERSQPRINRLLEEALEHGGMLPSQIGMPPPQLKRAAIKHMTGFPTVRHKLVCALAHGLWRRASSSRVLAYDVPAGASAERQRAALQAGLVLAESTHSLLALPPAFFDGAPVDVCRLFDVGNLPFAMLAAPLGAACAPTVNLSCADFASLSRQTTSGGATVRVCDPTSKHLDGTHSCTSNHALRSAPASHHAGRTHGHVDDDPVSAAMRAPCEPMRWPPQQRNDSTAAAAGSSGEATHVALSSDITQLAGATALVHSLLSATEVPAALHVHVLTTAGETQAAFERVLECSGLASAFGATVTVHGVDPSRFRLTSGRDSRVLAERVRIYLPALLPQVDKVLWLDADGIVRGDARALMAGLFEGEHSACGAAVVPRAKTVASLMRLSRWQLDLIGLGGVAASAPVWNAGLLAMNLRQWRARGTTRAVATLASRLATRLNFTGFPGMTPKSDTQSPLVLLYANGTAHGCLQHLPKAWMVDGLGWKRVDKAELCRAKFWHWSGPSKPWAHTHDSQHYRALWLPHQTFPHRHHAARAGRGDALCESSGHVAHADDNEGGLVPDACCNGSRVGLLYVVFLASGRPRSKPAAAYLTEAVDSALRAKQLNPELPVALATNLDVRAGTFNHVVSLNHTGAGRIAAGWAPRLEALMRSPFELTLALDASARVCSADLHAALSDAHARDEVDFSMNFAHSPFLPNMPRSRFPHLPARMEDVLPHNFAMLLRRGKGLVALHRRWARALAQHSDDQVALRATLRELAAKNYVECSDGGDGGTGGNEDACVRVRVQRLTERILGLKSADKMLPGWAKVPPRYSRPVAGEVLLVHSGPPQACDDANHDAPRLRIIAQALPGMPLASATEYGRCLADMQPVWRGYPSAAAWTLAQRVCAQLNGSAEGVTPALVQPLASFWAWMGRHHLTAE